MALVNSDLNYFKIGKVVGFNSIDTSLSVKIEEHKDEETRRSDSKFNKSVTHTIGIELDPEDLVAFVSKIYEKLKLLEDYKDMDDVLEVSNENL